jgi:hypothetical protein
MTATDRTRARGRALEAFYAAHHRRLTRAVFSRARQIDDDTIEDACAYGWLALVRRPHVTLDARGLRWLITVAVHEAWQLGAAREVPVGAYLQTSTTRVRRASPPDSRATRSTASSRSSSSASESRRSRPSNRANDASCYSRPPATRTTRSPAYLGGRCVNVAVLAGSDVEDMSPMEGGCRVPSEASAPDSGCCFCLVRRDCSGAMRKRRTT